MPTTGAPAHTGRTRSEREEIGYCVSLTLRDAAFETLSDLIFRQVAANENDAAVALFIRAPRPLMIAVEDHVHALKYETLGIVLERENPFAAQNIGAILGHQILNPRKELVRIQSLVGAQRDRLHVFIVVVLETVAMMMVMGAMIVIAMIVMMIVVMPFPFQKIRLDVEDAVEVEGVAPEHLIDVDLRALGAMQPRVRVQGVDARL